MSFRKKKSIRCEDNSDSTSPNMPHLPSLSGGESEIPPHFRHAVKSLSDSDDSSKSQSDDDSGCPSSSNASLYQAGIYGSNSSISSEDPTSKTSKKRALSLESIDDESATKKKRKVKNGETPFKPIISTLAQKMMKSMGYKEGSGLGKYGQGRTAPVEASKQKGRRGLGIVIADVDRDLIHYDPAKEVTDVHEVVDWLDGREEIELSTEDLCVGWRKIGAKKRILDDETHFCSPNVLKLVLICKSAFDKMSGEEMRRARSRSNPYELIKKGPYLNRAAMKMANMNSVFDEMFTQPVNEYGNPMVAADELLYFADVCAGPGGFSEYILSQKKWRAKGFGFTLRGDNDFKLADFYAGPCESFEPYYGTHGDGDVYKSENIISFSNHVHEHTAGRGVHFMMADGGFSVEGSENIQEILSKRIYLCQFLVALSIIRTSGHFVCKLFDVFTPFSVGLVYIMYRCFKRISIHKPNTSRPANSERYIICKWKLDNVDHVRDYLLAVNKEFDQYGEANDQDINEIVPLDIMKNDQKFYDYVLRSNNLLGERQINSLAKILQYSEDEELVEEKQQDLKKDCMEAWGVKIKARSAPNVDPEVMARNLLKKDTAYVQNAPEVVEEVSQLETVMKSIHDWHAVILGADSKNGTNATFFLGVSHKKCYKYDRALRKWLVVRDPHWDLELSPNTLLYGEIVSEATYQARRQMKRNVLHIIDGHTLGEEPIGHMHYTERVRLCALYASALNRPSMNTLMSIRMKDTYEMDELEDKSFCPMRQVTMKNMTEELAVPLNGPESESCEQFYIPRGIMFLKTTKFPYIRWISQSSGMKYYSYPQNKKQPRFDHDRPLEASNDCKETYAESKVWFVNKDVDQNPFNAQRFITELVFFIRSNKNKKKGA